MQENFPKTTSKTCCVSYSILYTPDFEKQLKRLAKKYRSLPNDLAVLIKELEENPKMGIPLGENCFKIRLAISSKGKGKSGGARIITCVFVADEEIYLAAIYDKSEQESLSDSEIRQLVKSIRG